MEQNVFKQIAPDLWENIVPVRLKSGSSTIFPIGSVQVTTHHKGNFVAV